MSVSILAPVASVAERCLRDEEGVRVYCWKRGLAYQYIGGSEEDMGRRTLREHARERGVDEAHLLLTYQAKWHIMVGPSLRNPRRYASSSVLLRKEHG